MCPPHFATATPYDTLHWSKFPRLTSATGTLIPVHGRKTLRFLLPNRIIVTIHFWVCDVQAPLLSVHSLTRSGLSLHFAPEGATLSKGSLSCPLTPNGPLWYLSTVQRLDSKERPTELDCPDLQLSPQELYQTYIAPLLNAPTPPGLTSWSDYWLTKHNCIVKVHKSARRKLYSPTDPPVPLTQLTGQRITHVKLFPSNKTSTVVDNYLTAPTTRPLTTSWSGYTVFPLKTTRNRLTAKGPEPPLTAADFNT